MIRFLCFVLLLVVSPFAMPQATETVPCKCGVFPVPAISEPIMQWSLQLNVTCDDEGEGKCLALCIALAKNARERAPNMICEKIATHVEDMQVAVYAKVCDAWKFTGLTNDKPICCHDWKSIPCRDVEA